MEKGKPKFIRKNGKVIPIGVDKKKGGAGKSKPKASSKKKKGPGPIGKSIQKSANASKRRVGGFIQAGIGLGLAKIGLKGAGKAVGALGALNIVVGTVRKNKADKQTRRAMKKFDKQNTGF